MTEFAHVGHLSSANFEEIFVLLFITSFKTVAWNSAYFWHGTCLDGDTENVGADASLAIHRQGWPL